MVLIMLLIGVAFGALLLRRNALPEGNTQVIEPSVKTVRATVDGKPVRSYVAED